MIILLLLSYPKKASGLKTRPLLFVGMLITEMILRNGTMAMIYTDSPYQLSRANAALQ